MVSMGRKVRAPKSRVVGNTDPSDGDIRRGKVPQRPDSNASSGFNRNATLKVKSVRKTDFPRGRLLGMVNPTRCKAGWTKLSMAAVARGKV